VAERAALRAPGLWRPTRRFPLIRHLSCRLTPWLLRLGLSAHQVTVASMLVGVGAALLLARGRWAASVAGALVLILSSVLDNCDGEIARFRGTASRFGGRLDDVADAVAHTALFIGLGLGVSRALGGSLWLWIGIAAALGTLIENARVLLREVSAGPTDLGPPEEDAGGPHWRREVSEAVRTFDQDFSLYLLPLALAGQLWIYLLAAAIGNHAFWIASLRTERRAAAGGSPRASLRDLVQHVRQCATLRRLLLEYDSPNLRELHWYDLRLRDAVRWRGILKVLLWNLAVGRRDEIAGNYALVNLYHAEPTGDGIEAPAPTVWHCRSLRTRPFFDGDSDVKRALEGHADVIAEEFLKLADRLEIHPDNPSLTRMGTWTGLFLFGVRGEKNPAVCDLCPETTRVVEGLPLCRNFGFVMFSGLEPGSHIAAHTGSSNLRLRHHLGVLVPEPDGPRIRVGSQERSWRQGRCLAFDDGFEHEVHHPGTRPRVVLSVDVWHPSLSERDVEFLSHPVFETFGKRTAGS
jgi:phosphatidylglycerophosphate synthase